MRAFNYAAYARTIEFGIANPNMTKIARALLEPIINHDGVVNHIGAPYNIDPKKAKDWYEQKKDIPTNIKEAAGRPEIVNSIGDYFSEEIVDGLINQMMENKMYSEMVSLVRDSDLDNESKRELLQCYDDGDRAEFLGRTFLYALVGDNFKTDSEVNVSQIDEDIRTFKKLIEKACKRPEKIVPPDEIEGHELGYVQELYKVYHEETGKDCTCPEDLDSHPKLKRDFNRQRKDYYSAETIRRELRDTIRQDETEGFDILKDEMYDGVITTRDKDYDSSLERLTAVMEHATKVSVSYNLQGSLLGWVGSSEKKGVCHMLVNDRRLIWTEGDNEC